MKRLKIVLVFILLAVIAGFLFAATNIFFIGAFTTDNSIQFNTLQGAFLGAFFVFIFLRIADALMKISDRHSKGRTALIKLQLTFNEYLSQLHDDVFLIDNFLGMIDATMKKNEMLPVWTSRLQSVFIDKEPIIALYNVELMNDVMTLNDDLRKLNNSYETINRTYEMISTSFLQNKINLDIYILNLKEQRIQCKQAREFTEKTKGEIVRLLALVSLLSKDDTLLGKFIGFILIKRFYPENVLTNLDKEIHKVNSDIRKNAAKSQKKINEVSEEIKSN